MGTSTKVPLLTSMFLIAVVLFAGNAHVQRAAAVEELYGQYSKRLESTYSSLMDHLHQEAPHLARQLAKIPPQRLRYGYRMVPEILPHARIPAKRPQQPSMSYSWPRTERMIRRQMGELARLLQIQLERIWSLEPSDRLAISERMVSDYKTLKAQHRLIDRHIQHNRFWQGKIAENPSPFDRQTQLYEAVLERAAIRSALEDGDASVFESDLDGLQSIDSAKTGSELELELRKRERTLADRIGAHTNQVYPRSFLKLDRPRPNSWVLRVPMFTDIEKESFLRSFKAAVESFWQIEDQGKKFRVELSISYIPPDKLYGKGAPARGTTLDLGQHVSLFPRDSGCLTTGARSTHVKGPRCIVLGPQPHRPRTLAHEFGHVLGFKDGYLRGYRDLGADGYEILEIVPDPQNIMSSPGYGEVSRNHFKALLESGLRVNSGQP